MGFYFVFGLGVKEVLIEVVIYELGFEEKILLRDKE